MSRLLLACALACAPVLGSRADDPKPAKRDALERALDALDQEVALRDGLNVGDVPLFELLQTVGTKHGVPFVLNEEAFKEVGRSAVREEKPRAAATRFAGLTVRQFLAVVLDSLDATFLIRNGAIEIVPVGHAARVTKSPLDTSGERARLKEPLVSAAIREKPLNEVAAKLAETYDLTVTVAPQAGDARTAFVSARLLNVPAGTALEHLALQADLRVVRSGTTFLLTSREHAEGLFNEKQDRARQRIELERFRDGPPAPLAPPPAPEKPKQ